MRKVVLIVDGGEYSVCGSSVEWLMPGRYQEVIIDLDSRKVIDNWGVDEPTLILVADGKEYRITGLYLDELSGASTPRDTPGEAVYVVPLECMVKPFAAEFSR